MNLETLLILAQNAVDAGNVQAACEFYEVALQKYPNNTEILEAYSEIMMHHVGDPARAQEMLRYAISVEPNDGFVKYLNLAQMCQGQEALELYNRAAEIIRSELQKTRKKGKKRNLCRSLSSTLCGVAELFLTDLCEEAEAEQACEQAISDALKCNPENIEAIQLRGSLRLSQQRPSEALSDLQHAVELTHRLGEEFQPTYDSKVELGKLLMQVDPSSAFRFLLEVLQLNDGNGYVWFLLAECARMRQKYHDAARLLKHARLLVDPDHDFAAIKEIDEGIAVLVSEMGGEEVVNAVPHMDYPNPLEFIENDEVEVEGEDEGEELEAEPEWQDVDDEDDE